MADMPMQMVAVQIPAELVAKLDEMKQYREEDREKSVAEIILEFCQSYVRVREMTRWELEHMDEIEKAYREVPDVWDDADVWDEEYPTEQDNQP